MRFSAFSILGLALCLNLGCGEKPAEKSKSETPAAGATTGGAPEQTAATPPPAAAADISAGRILPNPRFDAVRAKLDDGGVFYLYMDAKDKLRGLTTYVNNALPGMGLPAETMIPASLFFTELEKTGLYGAEEIGSSSVAEGELYRNKTFISVPGGRTGLLALLGGAPHKIDALEFAGADTMCFCTGDFDFAGLFAFVRTLVLDIGGQTGMQAFEQQLAMMKAQGLDVEAILKSLSGRSTVFGKLDAANKLSVPAQGGMVQIDSPKVALILDVNSPLLYETIQKLLTQFGAAAPESVAGGVKQFSVIFPMSAMFALSPVVGSDAGHFYFATHADYLAAALAAKQAGGGLAQTEDYKKLSAGFPVEANSLCYVSGAFQEKYYQFLAQMQGSGATQLNPGRLMLEMNMAKGGIFMTRRNEADGLMFFSRSSQTGRDAAMFLTGIPIIAVLAAIAVPNFLEAQTRAKVSRAKSDMRSMSVALEAYNLDYNTYPMPERVWQSLTTPVSFLTAPFVDPFGAQDGATLQYYAQPNATGGFGDWVLWSLGPDTDLNTTPEDLAAAYATYNAFRPYVVENAYDPTNGTISRGEVFRTKDR